MPDTSPSPGRPAASRARAPSSNQGDPETHPAAPARPRQTKRSGKPGIARAERQGTRWRDIQWVEFGSEPEPEAAVPSPLPPEADAPAAASPGDDDSVEKMLRQFAPAAPESGRIDIPGLASRFARQAVPGPIALRAARERPAAPASAISALARLRSGVGREPKLEAASSETGTVQPPDTTAAAHGERADDDEHFPASILTPVGSAAEPQPAGQSIARSLDAQLSQAGAVLRRKRESVGNAVSTRLMRASAMLRPRRPTPSPLPAAKAHPIVVPESPAEPAAPRIEPAAEAAAPPAPEPRPATPSRASVLAARIQDTALRLAGNDPERLRRRLVIAGAAIVIAVAAYAVGAMVAGLAGSNTTRHTGSERPAPAVQAVTAQPQAKPPPPQAAATPPNDPVERAAFYLARAKAGDPVAQYDIGVLYALGSGLVQDYASAASWFHTAAAQGNIDAEYNLGVLYERGLGVTASSIEAVNWYRSAADQNHARAQYNLALAYAEGRGTEQDLAAAARWYQRAAQQGLAPAMINLAILYERGQGVDRSPIDAFAWYSAAGERGDGPARDRAAELFRQFSDQDKAKAQGLAATIAASINGAPPA